MKLLDQHCELCFARGVVYVKTKGGFRKLCESCKKVVADAGLTVEPLIVYAMETNQDAEK